MFNLGRLDDLALALGIRLNFLHEVLDDFDTAPESLVKELTLWPGDQSKKSRDVISIRKRWRRIQWRIYVKLLLPRFKPSNCSHGGVKQRSPATNARAHLGNTFVCEADIANFFPSISCNRVNDLFLKNACTYKVARALTRLCTYDYQLALGLVTSPIIANELLRGIDEEIERFCRRNDLVYTRFIDDITISGKYDPRRCKVGEIIQSILERHRFKIAKNKTAYGRLDVAPVRERTGNDGGQLSITGVRLKAHHIDPSRKFIQELSRIMDDHLSLSRGGLFNGPLYMQGEVFGKAYYACSLNPGRRRSILGRMKAIDWSKVLDNAVRRDLRRSVNRLVPRGTERPASEELPMAANARRFREYCETHVYARSIVPFDVPDDPETTAGQ